MLACVLLTAGANNLTIFPPVIATHLMIPDTSLFGIDDEATDLAYFLLPIPAAAVCSCTSFCISFKGRFVCLQDMPLGVLKHMQLIWPVTFPACPS